MPRIKTDSADEMAELVSYCIDTAVNSKEDFTFGPMSLEKLAKTGLRLDGHKEPLSSIVSWARDKGMEVLEA